MSLLTPERLRVKVYRWDDAGAPALDKTAGCMMAIFKACLVTGYGEKEGAGWTMPFEDAAGVKVLCPEAGPHTDFYLRLSGDDGIGVTAQVYTNMSDINNGELKLQCEYPFYYGKRGTWSKWILVASASSIWLFNEAGSEKSGNYFFCGNIYPVSAATPAVYMQHTGGSSPSGSAYGGITDGYSSSTAQYGELLYLDSVTSRRLSSTFSSKTQLTDKDFGAPLWLSAYNEIFICPGVYSSASGAKLDNFSMVDMVGAKSLDSKAVAFGSTAVGSDNYYLLTESWST